MRPVVRRQVRDGEALCVQPAPAAEADEDHVADRGGHKARDQHREERRAHRDAALHHHHPAHDRAAEERRDRGERAGGGENGLLPLPERAGKRHHHPDDRAECDQRCFGPEHGTEGKRADRRERDPRRMRDGRSAAADALERRVAAVPREQRPSEEDDARAGGRQQEHEVPRRGRVAECLGQAVPQPVLEVVHHREEERGEKRRRDPDHRSERDKPQVRAAAEGLRLGHGTTDASGTRGRPRVRARGRSAPG
jgi:hypothetical protein